MKHSILLLCFIFILIVSCLNGEGANRRKSKEIEMKINNLNPDTKKRIQAMKNAGELIYTKSFIRLIYHEKVFLILLLLKR